MDSAVNALTGDARAQLEAQVRSFNSALNAGTPTSQDLGKDDFLRILLTQLTNQDPTAPLEDKEFVAQMAQFSSLEQMTNMATSFSQMSQTLLSGQALGLIGRTVQISTEDGVVSGTATAITAGADPKVKVDDVYYNYSDVLSVSQ